MLQTDGPIRKHLPRHIGHLQSKRSDLPCGRQIIRGVYHLRAAVMKGSTQRIRHRDLSSPDLECLEVGNTLKGHTPGKTGEWAIPGILCSDSHRERLSGLLWRGNITQNKVVQAGNPIVDNRANCG